MWEVSGDLVVNGISEEILVRRVPEGGCLSLTVKRRHARSGTCPWVEGVVVFPGTSDVDSSWEFRGPRVDQKSFTQTLILPFSPKLGTTNIGTTQSFYAGRRGRRTVSFI